MTSAVDLQYQVGSWLAIEILVPTFWPCGFRTKTDCYRFVLLITIVTILSLNPLDNFGANSLYPMGWSYCFLFTLANMAVASFIISMLT